MLCELVLLSLCVLRGLNILAKGSIYPEFFILNFALTLSVYQDEFMGVNESLCLVRGEQKQIVPRA